MQRDGYDRTLIYSRLTELLERIIELADRSVQQQLEEGKGVGMRTVVSLLQVALSLLQMLDSDLFEAMKVVRQRNAERLAGMLASLASVADLSSLELEELEVEE